MNQQQIKKLKESLPSRIDYPKWTEEQKQLDKELSCIEMINSCLIYGYDFMKDWSKTYIEELGYDKVKSLYEQQVEHFQHCTIVVGSGTDCEGNVYNSVIENNLEDFA